MPSSPFLSPDLSSQAPRRVHFVACPRDLRLRRHADFQSVYKNARKQYAKEMSFFFALRNSHAVEDLIADLQDARRQSATVPSGPRIGLTVGKVLGKAHERNRIKRRLREAIRMHADLLGGLPLDLVLHPRRTVLTLEWPRIDREVAQIFRTVRKLATREQPPSQQSSSVSSPSSSAP